MNYVRCSNINYHYFALWNFCWSGLSKKKLGFKLVRVETKRKYFVQKGETCCDVNSIYVFSKQTIFVSFMNSWIIVIWISYYLMNFMNLFHEYIIFLNHVIKRCINIVSFTNDLLVIPLFINPWYYQLLDIK